MDLVLAIVIIGMMIMGVIMALSYVASFVVSIMPIIVTILLFWIIIKVFIKVYISSYFNGDKFKSFKQDINDYITECNELNNHIEKLRESYLHYKKTNFGYTEIEDESIYNYKRNNLGTINSDYIYDCSLTVFRNSKNKPFPYLCKYFNIPINEESLERFEDIFNQFASAEEGKTILSIKYNEIKEKISNNVPKLVIKKATERLNKELNFKQIDFNKMYFPKYVFRYVSPAGNKKLKNPIILDLENLENFIKFLSDNIKRKESIQGQRALMTQQLRKRIKERDNYTCCYCHNSISQEPNLLLEIDHIIPLSKGGKTEERNLQTLCWKCNRSKGNKIIQNIEIEEHLQSDLQDISYLNDRLEPKKIDDNYDSSLKSKSEQDLKSQKLKELTKQIKNIEKIKSKTIHERSASDSIECTNEIHESVNNDVSKELVEDSLIEKINVATIKHLNEDNSKEVVEEIKDASNKTPKDFTIPGFRTKKLWKEILALMGYGFIIFYILASGEVVLFSRVTMVLWMLETIAIFSNYLSIRDDLPFYDSKYLIVRLTSTIVFWIIILFLTLLLVVLIF